MTIQTDIFGAAVEESRPPFLCDNHRKYGQTCHLCKKFPLSRISDPVTSFEAAASVRNITETHQNIVTILEDLRQATDEEIANYYAQAVGVYGWKKVSPSGLRSRRAELVDAGILKDSGVKGRTASGRLTIKWARP